MAHTTERPEGPLRVAAYCRVSTDKEDQRSSLAAQQAYFAQYIQGHQDWAPAGVFADEGLSGTSAARRPQFRRMVQLALAGEIDLIVTKEVSRFARNTVDTLALTRELKAQGVGVIFLNDGIDTRQEDGEFRLTIMASVAQEESRKISQRTRWGQAQAMKRGVVFGNDSLYGYTLSHGRLTVRPEQAEVVRAVYRKFLAEGKGTYVIARELTQAGIAPPLGPGGAWSSTAVLRLLRNEKYTGDLLQQKYLTTDHLTHKKIPNDGRQPQLLLRDHHEAIVSRADFLAVQEELARRSSLKKTSSKAKTQLGKYCGKYVLSELLVCGECGSPYRRVIWTQKGVKRVVWRCQNRLEHGRKICKQSPTLDEGDIHDAVISAMNELFRMQAAKDAVKAGIAAVLAGEEQTMSLPAVELQIRNLQERQLELFQLIVSAGADCTDYDEELQQVNIAKTRLMAQKAELEKEQRGAAAFESRLAELDMALEQASGTLTDFDELTVRQLVSNIKVLDKDSLLICFKDGTEITQAMQRRQAA